MFRLLTRPLRYVRTRWALRQRLKLTGEGRLFLAMAVGIGLAAINTGNNLLYLVLGWLLSLVIASGGLSNLTLRKLSLRRQVPERVHAGSPFLVGVTVENNKRRAASFSIEVEDMAGGEVLDTKCLFLKIPAGTSMTASYSHTIATRGRHRLDGFVVSTGFPFTQFRKSIRVPHEGEIVVYPAVHQVRLPAPPGRHAGAETKRRAGRGDEFFGLREYRDGDDSRAIHWPSSARGGRLLLRESEERAQRQVTLDLDNQVASPGDADALDALEQEISRAASLAVAYLRAGVSVRLVTRDHTTPLGSGRHHEHHLLRILALLEPKMAGEPGEAA